MRRLPPPSLRAPRGRRLDVSNCMPGRSNARTRAVRHFVIGKSHTATKAWPELPASATSDELCRTALWTIGSAPSACPIRRKPFSRKRIPEKATTSRGWPAVGNTLIRGWQSRWCGGDSKDKSSKSPKVFAGAVDHSLSGSPFGLAASESSTYVHGEPKLP